MIYLWCHAIVRPTTSKAVSWSLQERFKPYKGAAFELRYAWCVHGDDVAQCPHNFASSLQTSSVGVRIWQLNEMPTDLQLGESDRRIPIDGQLCARQMQRDTVTKVYIKDPLGIRFVKSCVTNHR